MRRRPLMISSPPSLPSSVRRRRPGAVSLVRRRRNPRQHLPHPGHRSSWGSRPWNLSPSRHREQTSCRRMARRRSPKRTPVLPRRSGWRRAARAQGGVEAGGGGPGYGGAFLLGLVGVVRPGDFPLLGSSVLLRAGGNWNGHLAGAKISRSGEQHSLQRRRRCGYIWTVNPESREVAHVGCRPQI
jgi:hypothetical protein